MPWWLAAGNRRVQGGLARPSFGDWLSVARGDPVRAERGNVRHGRPRRRKHIDGTVGNPITRLGAEGEGSAR